MNLSDFIDKLIELEIDINGANRTQVEFPVYVVDSCSGISGLAMGAFVRENDHSNAGDLLDLDKGLKYVEVSVG